MAARLSKKQKLIRESLTLGKVYNFVDAVDLLKKLPQAKFKNHAESIDVAINLGINSKKSEQTVRGATLLPAGTGKKVRVAVFTQGKNAELAIAAGADKVGMADLAQEIKAGNLDYDVIVASPDAMAVVGALGAVLGPRGLMPNPKLGTVTQDIATAVKNAKGGQIRYKADKNGIIHCTIGKIDFAAEDLKKNIQTLINDLRKLKPSTSKGVYLKKVSLSTTMGPGLNVEISGLDS